MSGRLGLHPWHISTTVACLCLSVVAKTVNYLDDVGLVQLSASYDERTTSDTKGDSRICVVQDNRCFDRALDAPGGSATSGGSYGSGAYGAHSRGEQPTLPLSVEIVVTRAGEDIQWLDAFPNIQTTVYNRKGSPSVLPTPRPNLRVIPSKNIGREDDSMMQHIVENYDNLPNATVFLQGWPFLHCGDMINTVNRVLQAWTDPVAVQALGPMAMDGLVPLSRAFYEYNIPKGLVGIARSMIDEDPDDTLRSQPTYDEALPQGYMGIAREMFSRTCEEVIGQKCPQRLWVSEGAQWVVSGDRIRNFPRDKYEHSLSLGEGYEHKWRGLVLEALWPVLWGAAGWNPMDTSSPLDPIHLPHSPILQPPPTLHPHRQIGFGGFDLGPEHAGNVMDAKLAPAPDHCASGSGSAGLVWSCEARMGFCEFSRHQSRSPSGSSQAFAEQRPRFLVSAPGDPWSMVVTLSAPTLAAETHHMTVVPGEGVRLISGNSTTRWTIQASGGKDDGYFISLENANLFLECGRHGYAKLSNVSFAWKFVPKTDGLLEFESVDKGHVLAIEMGAPDLSLDRQSQASQQSQKRARAVTSFLRCYDPGEERDSKGDVAFSIDLVEKDPFDSVDANHDGVITRDEFATMTLQPDVPMAPMVHVDTTAPMDHVDTVRVGTTVSPVAMNPAPPPRNPDETREPTRRWVMG